MTPPAATAAGRLGHAPRAPVEPGHRRGVRRGPAPRAPRRVSGPARPPRSAATTGAAAAAGLGRIELRLPRPALGRIGGRLQLGGLLGGRMWIGIFAALLLGLVFLQVSLLKLNSAISQNVARAQVLERQNAGARGTISRLDAGQRIQDVAGQLGMVMPGAGAVCYLRAGTGSACSGGDAAAAAAVSDPLANTAPPDPAGSTAATDAAAADPAAAQTDPAPAAADQTAAATDPAATPAPAAAAPVQSPAPAPAGGAPVAAAPATTDTGGISAATAAG